MLFPFLAVSLGPLGLVIFAWYFRERSLKSSLRRLQGIRDQLILESELQALSLQRAQEKEASFQSLLNTLPAAFLVVEACGGELGLIRRVNEAYCSLWGPNKTPEDFVGKKISATLEQEETLQALFLRVLQHRRPQEGEVFLSGRHWVVYAASHPTSNQVVGLFYDVTGLRRVEQSIREFILTLANELKESLDELKDSSEQLRHLPPTSGLMSLLETMKAQESRMEALISDTVQLAEVELGHHVLHPMSLSLQGLIRDTSRAFEEILKTKNISFESRIPSELSDVMVWVDSDAFRRVLAQLIDNAIQFTPVAGKITLVSTIKGDFCEITLVDNGVGISEDELPHLFEKFYRIDQTRKPWTPGSLTAAQGGGEKSTGLGLAIVEHFVHALGGEIQVTSRVGEGTSVSFTVPLWKRGNPVKMA